MWLMYVRLGYKIQRRLAEEETPKDWDSRGRLHWESESFNWILKVWMDKGHGVRHGDKNASGFAGVSEIDPSSWSGRC